MELPFGFNKLPRVATGFTQSAMAFVGLASGIAVLLIILHFSAPSIDLEMLMLVETLAFLFWIFCHLVAIILNAVWIFRTGKNAHVIQNVPDRIGAHMAWGWYLVPFANLWLPRTALVEIWNSSHDPQGNIDRKPPSYFNTWWASWIGFYFVARLAGTGDTDDFVFLIEGQIGFALMGVLYFFAATKFIQIMREITARQTELGSNEGTST